MYKNLEQLCIALSLSALALITGCASNPGGGVSSNGDEPGSSKSITTFDEQSVAALADDEFWSKGAQATVDADGRLVYRLSPQIVDDGNYNRLELEVQRPDPSTLRYDPITGYPILRSNRPFVRTRPRNPEGVIAPRGMEPTFQPAPRIQPPVTSAPRRSDSGTRRSRDSRR